MRILPSRNKMSRGPERALTRIMTRAGLFAPAVLVALICFSFADSARSLNSHTQAAPCACTTTAQFVAAAKPLALQAGTYTMISTTGASSAAIQITGHGTGHGEGFTIVTAVPVDSTGASIAGESESSQEAYYAALDQTLFGTNRGGPITTTCPSDYSESFVNSIDEEVGPGIDLALSLQGISWASLPIGQVITVHFADGTSAEYIKTSSMTDHWAWNGVAHNSANKKILRNGQLASNPNTSGTGGGSVFPPGFGSVGGKWGWSYTAVSYCAFSSYATLPDGSTIGGSGWGPC